MSLVDCMDCGEECQGKCYRANVTHAVRNARCVKCETDPMARCTPDCDTETLNYKEARLIAWSNDVVERLNAVSNLIYDLAALHGPVEFKGKPYTCSYCDKNWPCAEYVMFQKFKQAIVKGP